MTLISRPTAYIVSACCLLTVGVSLSAQPPQTRDSESGPNSPRGDARPPLADDSSTDWPQVRRQGQQRREGVRSTQEQAERTYQNRASVGILPGGGTGPPSAQWYLGINAGRSPKGVRIDRVEYNTPAARIGLEPGDYILDVGGYVVGEYQGVYYPLSLAMDYGADSQGWAELLVWNRRTYAEETVWVRFRRR